MSAGLYVRATCQWNGVTAIHTWEVYSPATGPSHQLLLPMHRRECAIFLRFASFVKKNSDTPFYVKRRVFDATLMSTVLYGCESWLIGDLKPVVKLYNWCIKQLLGVRMTTYNDQCYLELGLPPLRALIISRQRKFFRCMWRERRAMNDDPWSHAVRLAMEANVPTGRFISDITFSRNG